jgi:hypothetical protein
MGCGISDANTMLHSQPGNSYRLRQLRMETIEPPSLDSENLMPIF